MNITLSQAIRLFKEANDYETNVTQYITPNSELRQIAKAVFGRDTVTTLIKVCEEVFRVLAVAYTKETR